MPFDDLNSTHEGHISESGCVIHNLFQQTGIAIRAIYNNSGRKNVTRMIDNLLYQVIFRKVQTVQLCRHDANTF